MYELVTHRFHKVRTHKSFPLCVEVPAQGDGSRPNHGRVWHSQLAHGGGCQVDHDHPHAAGPRLRAVIIAAELCGVDGHFALVGLAESEGVDVDQFGLDGGLLVTPEGNLNLNSNESNVVVI